MKISILGAGAYASSLASVFYDNKCTIKMWTNSDKERDIINKTRHIDSIDYDLPSDILVSTDMDKVVMNTDIIVVAVPSIYVADTMDTLSKYYNRRQIICIASKGIDENNLSFMYDIVKKYINTKHIGVLSGGTFAKYLAMKSHSGLTIATSDYDTRDKITEAISASYLKLDWTDDIIGTEICGSVKNVMAILCGIVDGMGESANTKALLINTVINNIKDLITILGGKEDTIFSSAGIEDVFLTCTSTDSRNYSFGKLIGESASNEEIDKYLNTNTVEGINTLNVIRKILRKNKMKMEIFEIINDVINGKKKKEDILKFLVK